MVKKAKTAIVIPNWNGEELLGSCLESLLNQATTADIIVVDNGSADGSVKLLKQSFPSVRVIALPANRGFAGGVNAGIRQALEDNYIFIGLFNNDAVADKHWLAELLAAAEQQAEAGIITGKFLSIDKVHIDSTGELFHSWGVPSSRGRGQSDQGQFDTPGYVFGASGGASLYRAELFRAIGLFDEDFFAYGEDADINFRAQLAGWRVYYQPTAMAYHHMNATSAKIRGFHAYHTMKNLPLIIWKNLPLRLLPVYLFRFSIMYAITFWGMSRRGSGGAALRGALSSLVLLPKKLGERWRVQRQRRVTVAYIRSLISTELPPGVTRLRRFLRLFGLRREAL